MKQLKVELLITLDEDIIEEARYTDQDVIDIIKLHIKTAVGNRGIQGFGTIWESEIKDIKYVKAVKA